MRDVWFAVPGDLATLTGGYIYAQQLLSHLPACGWRARHLQLPGSFPRPSASDLAATRAAFGALPPGSIVLIDGLAFGAMPVLSFDKIDLKIAALVHHPLALESGLTADDCSMFRDSERASLTLARRVIATGPATARTLMQDYGVPAEHLVVARPGTDRAPRATATATPPRLLTVATVTPRKAHDVLIEALAQIATLPWQAQFVGSLDRDPIHVANVHRAIHMHRLASRIEVCGELSGAALEQAYQSASMFVLPSLHEGYGMAFAEALARGLPIIGTTAGAIPDTVPSDAGLLAPPGEANALARALEECIGDPALRLRMADASWRHGQKLPTWAETAQCVAETLEAIV